MENVINGFNINSKGYGTIPKVLMQDKDIHICAKAIYAYFCSYTGSGNTCFPTREKICSDLNIAKDTFGKYLGQLVEHGYIEISQVREQGKFSHNVYTLLDTITQCPNKAVSDNAVSENFVHDELVTKNNSLKSNNIKNNININNNNNIYNYSKNEDKKSPSKEGVEVHNNIGSSVNKSSTRANESQYKDEFEKLWKQYPNKKGKPKALNYYIKARKNGTSYDDVENGIINYIKDIKIKGTAANYIKHGSTWFNNRCWEDEYNYDEMNDDRYSADKDYSGGWD